MRILVADDEDRIRKLVGDFLSRSGYEIIEAEDGGEALRLATADPVPDLIILDVMMPVLDGWTVLSEIRRQNNVPVILLTAKGTENDQLGGFRLGADDYITKPFSPSLLVARVEALLKRGSRVNENEPICGDISIDEVAHVAYVKGKPLELTPKEYNLLLYFIENRGVALSREKILNGVWNYDYFGDLRTVDTHVKQLRSKLGEAGNMIVTVRGVGYRLEVK
ncbi:MAG: response regulator transcription factor [Clostridia bacterium]|nr:response regulator transcription factor [Clostridia bacterium]MBQ5545355.1 response regulator transcription factor [Clostridia bacterium]